MPLYFAECVCVQHLCLHDDDNSNMRVVCIKYIYIHKHVRQALQYTKIVCRVKNDAQ